MPRRLAQKAPPRSCSRLVAEILPVPPPHAASSSEPPMAGLAAGRLPLIVVCVVAGRAAGCIHESEKALTHRISDKAAACNFVAHANIYRHRADHAATVTKRLPSQLGRARQLERFGVLNSRLVELEELAAIGQRAISTRSTTTRRSCPSRTRSSSHSARSSCGCARC